MSDPYMLPPLKKLIRALLICMPLSLEGSDLDFDGTMSEPVLRGYLSRSMTLMHLLADQGDFNDNLRMMKNTGVKIAGRAVYNWGREQGGESALPGRLARARENATKVHAIDPEIILQACVFEIVSDDVNKLKIPEWIFEELSLPVETRTFHFEDMGYINGRGRDQWGKATCIPDVSRRETQLWFHFLAASYIDIGCEAIHFGQAELMNGNDPELVHWSAVLARARAHARKHARRHFLLCDAHVPDGGLKRGDHLLFDFHSFPLRIEEVSGNPREGRLRVGFSDAFYGRSKGGTTPGGWKCEHLPFLVELDNYGRSSSPGSAGMGVHWVWGWDEITWFSQQPRTDRDDWLRNAWQWVRQNDSASYLQMPGIRCLSGAADGKRWYFANQASLATPGGYGQEAVIREIWQNDAPSAPITKGLRVFTCGNSFHAWFVPEILKDMAEKAGIKGHEIVGVSKIGGSRAIQHWDIPDAQNEAKPALIAAKADVLTLACLFPPDDGIGKFATLAAGHNPAARVLLQEFWIPRDKLEWPFQGNENEVNFDAATPASLRALHDPYFKQMDDHVVALNQKLGRQVVFVVPVGQAVVALRERVIAGKVPGIQRQSQLFTDKLGHPQAPVEALASYCNFAVLYRRTPVGLPMPDVLAKSSNPLWRNENLNLILQQLAWDAVTGQPLAGVARQDR